MIAERAATDQRQKIQYGSQEEKRPGPGLLKQRKGRGERAREIEKKGAQIDTYNDNRQRYILDSLIMQASSTILDWLQSLIQFFINVLVDSLILMALF